MEFSIEFLEDIFVLSTKYNPLLSPHVKCVILKKFRPMRRYIFKIYRTISTIVTMHEYVNTISHFHALKFIDKDVKENVIYKNYLSEKITNPRDKTKFKNLTDSVGKHFE